MALLISLFFIASPPVAHADPASLFNSQAIHAANSIRVSFAASARSRYSNKGAFQLDTVDSILSSNENTNRIADYKLFTYFRNNQDFLNNSYINEVIEARAAQNLFLYQVGKSFAEAIKDSTLKDTYEEIETSLKEVKNKTTFELVESSSGKLEIEQGEEPREPLVRLRLHLSARAGLEPRIQFRGGWLLRCNPLSDTFRMEYSKRF